MKVILDASQVYDRFNQAYKYFHEMLPRMANYPDIAIELVPSPTGVVALPDTSTAVVRDTFSPAKKFVPHGPLRRFLSSQKKHVERALWALRKRERVLFHSTYYTLPPTPKLPLLTTAHDIIPEKFGDKFGCVPNEKSLAHRRRCFLEAHHLLAVSENTKRDLIEHFGIAPEKIDVVYNGVDIPFFEKAHGESDAARFRAEMGLDAPFLLQVGGRLHHKNFPRLLEAFAALGNDLVLVAAGEPLEVHEHELIKKLGLTGRVKNVVKPEEDALRMLYRLASVFVYPSLYEGFGIPPIEAMASGAPVAAARAGSIPEIVGDAAVLFDPASADDMRRAIESLLDPGRAADYRSRGRERARLFTWDNVAEGTAAVYRKLLAS